jgi:hypothetical protein
LFSGLAFLFNPFLPIYLTSELWMPIDLTSASILLWSVFQDGTKRTLHRSASRESISKVETGSQSVSVTETSDEASDDDVSKLMELFASKQVRNYAFSNPDLQNAFSRVFESHASPGEMGQRTADFVAQVARIADRPLPKTLREARDLLHELSREAVPDAKLIGDILSHEWLTGRFQSEVANSPANYSRKSKNSLNGGCESGGCTFFVFVSR